MDQQEVEGGFYVTSMATSGTRWAVVMSRNAGFVDQCVELDFMYPSEGIHRRWDSGFRITCCAATPGSGGVRPPFPAPAAADETQETLRTSAFPAPRQGEVGEESVHQRRRVWSNGLVVGSSTASRDATTKGARGRVSASIPSRRTPVCPLVARVYVREYSAHRH